MKVNLFIVGTPKAGTTSLHHYLNEFPEILMSIIKEPDFFSHREIQEQGLYYGSSRINTLTKYNRLFSDWIDESIIGEASVSYLFYPDVPERIKLYNDNSKIIIMLRNPTERAFSHYLMDYRLGLTSNSFEEEFDKKTTLNFQQYFLLGNYFHQVKRYLDIFGKENVHIIWYSNFKEKTENELNKVISFLGLNTNFRVDFNKIHNSFSMPKNNFIRKIYSIVWLRKTLSFLLPINFLIYIKKVFFNEDNKPKLSEKTRELLCKYYLSDIESLEELLSVNLSQWKK
tara:strand:- start:533 stop:1387 length:855 start_codon:yes stop_codon:yes gene_type:complete